MGEGGDGLWRVLVPLVASWVGFSQTNKQTRGSLREGEQGPLLSGPSVIMDVPDLRLLQFHNVPVAPEGGGPLVTGPLIVLETEVYFDPVFLL